MTDINPVRLKKLIEHFRDDGQATPTIVASILKSLPENTEFLRDYVKAAAEEIKDPSIVTAFEAELAAPPVTVVEKPAPAPVSQSAPPAVSVLQSVPEAELPSFNTPGPGPHPAGALPPNALTGQPLPFEGWTFRYRGADGISIPLRALTTKGKTVILERAPEQAPADELVDVVLKGQTVSLNLTLLRTLPAGQDFETPVGTFAVAALLIIADAAKH